jgi:alanine-glyoxylate transaminase/serine-glyoxylate transaminase/serine-pyruvate transaminase
MSDPERETIGELLPPERLMLTPGPSCVDPRVYRAMVAPIVGHMDPWFTNMMGDVQTLLRRVFQTQNRITFPISASGSGGIEAAVVNPLDAATSASSASTERFRSAWRSSRSASRRR